jgi:hypothetical protein
MIWLKKGHRMKMYCILAITSLALLAGCDHEKLSALDAQNANIQNALARLTGAMQASGSLAGPDAAAAPNVTSEKLAATLASIETRLGLLEQSVGKPQASATGVRPIPAIHGPNTVEAVRYAPAHSSAFPAHQPIAPRMPEANRVLTIKPQEIPDDARRVPLNVTRFNVPVATASPGTSSTKVPTQPSVPIGSVPDPKELNKPAVKADPSGTAVKDFDFTPQQRPNK